MLGKIVNFVILFGGLCLLLRTPLRNFLAKRSADIRASLDGALAERSEAERRLAEAETRLSGLADETAGILADAEREGLLAKERIRDAAGREADRIKSFTSQEIDAQLKAGMKELETYTIGLAAALAEARLRDDLTAADQATLIDRSIDRLAEIHEESNSR